MATSDPEAQPFSRRLSRELVHGCCRQSLDCQFSSSDCLYFSFTRTGQRNRTAKRAYEHASHLCSRSPRFNEESQQRLAIPREKNGAAFRFCTLPFLLFLILAVFFPHRHHPVHGRLQLLRIANTFREYFKRLEFSRASDPPVVCGQRWPTGLARRGNDLG